MIIPDKKIQKCKEMTSKHTKMCLFGYEIEDISRIFEKNIAAGLLLYVSMRTLQGKDEYHGNTCNS